MRKYDRTRVLLYRHGDPRIYCSKHISTSCPNEAPIYYPQLPYSTKKMTARLYWPQSPHRNHLEGDPTVFVRYRFILFWIVSSSCSRKSQNEPRRNNQLWHMFPRSLVNLSHISAAWPCHDHIIVFMVSYDMGCTTQQSQHILADLIGSHSTSWLMQSAVTARPGWSKLV